MPYTLPYTTFKHDFRARYILIKTYREEYFNIGLKSCDTIRRFRGLRGAFTLHTH